MNRLILLPILLLLCFPATLVSQELDSGLGDLTGFMPETPDASFSAKFIVSEDGKSGQLQFVADVLAGCHIFSVTQTYPGGPGKPTVIAIEEGYDLAEIVGEFEADQDFEIHEYEFVDEPGEEHHGVVTWSAPIKFAEGVDPNELIIPVKYTAQVCVDGDGGTCLPFKGTVRAHSAAAPVTFSYEFAPEDTHTTIRGWADRTHVQPGESFNLNIQLEADEGYLFEGYAVSPIPDSNPTLIVLTKDNDSEIDDVQVSQEPEQVSIGEATRQVHKGPVTWTLPITVPRDMEQKRHSFAGRLAFRTANEAGAGDPAAVAFKFDVTVGTATVDAQNNLAMFVPDGIDYGQVGSLAQKAYESNKKNAGKFADMSIPAVLGLAFIAGLILNVMPCVLPVIGLKVLSFVQQAGENPRRVLFLNLTFAAGIVAVFLLLAAFAAFMGLGWGGLFESQAFTIVMVSVVFAFGLSFLGVWEIPIPGFVAASGHGKAAQQEGYMGAFLKGILTTLLATPCSGPLLIPAVTWAIAQPPAITFLTFLALGLGMAFPFIVIGFRPSLVSFLPKPGDWMETFKQLMGFVMIATAVFFFNPITDKYEMPVLAFLVFVGLGCWMAGRISLLQPFPVRARKWVSVLMVIGLGAFVGFYLMIPQHELDWEPYSQATLNERVAEGNVVFVDFTADW